MILLGHCRQVAFSTLLLLSSGFGGTELTTANRGFNGGQGVVSTGKNPIAGVDVELYAAGSTGYGSSPVPVFRAGSVTTDAEGRFTLPAWRCPAPDAMMYLVGTGGKPLHRSPAVTNSNLAMMAALGRCADLPHDVVVHVNELTTVAAVWALAPFMSGMQVGSSATNPAGLAEAFQGSRQLVSTVTGAMPGTGLPAGATLPVAELNTLADILKTCIGSGGGNGFDTPDGVTGGTPCGRLFFLAPNPLSSVTAPSYPANTIKALLNIARNPARNAAKLAALSHDASSAFLPHLSAAPLDWTVAVVYSGGGLSSPSALAIDATGSVWVANAGNSSVTKLMSSGFALSGPKGFTAGAIHQPQGIAMDTSGRAWITNSAANTLTQLDADGLHGSTFTGGGLQGPRSVAVDTAGVIWVTNSGADAHSISAFQSSDGTPLPSSPFQSQGIRSPRAVGIMP